MGKTFISLALTKAFIKCGLKTKCVAFNAPDDSLEGFSVEHYSVTECLTEYLSHFIPAKKIIHKALSNKLSSVVLNVTPGLTDMARLGKITSGPRGFGVPIKEDIIVVDSYSTGYFQTLLKAPQSFYDIVPLGYIKKICQEIKEVLKESHFIVTSLPEAWSLMETEDTFNFLNRWGAKHVYHFTNRIFKEDLTDELQQWLKKPKLMSFYEKKYLDQTKILKNIKRDVDLSQIDKTSHLEVIESLSKELEVFCKTF